MKRLRQYIRQVLLTEAAKGVSDLPKDVYVVIENNWPMSNIYFATYNEILDEYISTDLDGDENWDTPVGFIEIRHTEGKCLDGAVVTLSEAESGWGPFLYDIAMEWATLMGSGLMSDREVVSQDAQSVWDYYYYRRSDVTNKQLDNEVDSFKNGTQDDCTQDSARKNAKEAGHGDWAESELSKVYSKSPKTIRALGDRLIRL